MVQIKIILIICLALMTPTLARGGSPAPSLSPRLHRLPAVRGQGHRQVTTARLANIVVLPGDQIRLGRTMLPSSVQPIPAAAYSSPGEAGAKTEEEKKKARQNLRRLIVFILVIGVGGMFLVWLLFICWRRLNRRTIHKRKAGKKKMPDVWQAGGDRLSSKIEQEMRAEEGIHSLDDIPDEDEENDQDEYEPDDDEDEDQSEDDDETF